MLDDSDLVVGGWTGFVLDAFDMRTQQGEQPKEGSMEIALAYQRRKSGWRLTGTLAYTGDGAEYTDHARYSSHD